MLHCLHSVACIWNFLLIIYICCWNISCYFKKTSSIYCSTPITPDLISSATLWLVLTGISLIPWLITCFFFVFCVCCTNCFIAKLDYQSLTELEWLHTVHIYLSPKPEHGKAIPVCVCKIAWLSLLHCRCSIVIQWFWLIRGIFSVLQWRFCHHRAGEYGHNHHFSLWANFSLRRRILYGLCVCCFFSEELLHCMYVVA